MRMRRIGRIDMTRLMNLIKAIKVCQVGAKWPTPTEIQRLGYMYVCKEIYKCLYSIVLYISLVLWDMKGVT